MFTTAQYGILRQALETYEAQVKRAMNTKKDPRFAALYEQDLKDINELWFILKNPPKEEPKK